VFWIGMLLTGLGLVIGLFGRGWTALLIGIGCVVLGIITSQIPVVHLGKEMKSIDASLTPKRASDLASRHLRQRGDDINEPRDTQVFLGKFGGEADVVRKHRRAAEQGNALAQYNLGFDYQQGFGVAQDEGEAAKWFRKAAKQNHPKAQYSLAWAYHHGSGVEKNNVEAVKWFRKAADQGHVDALYNLGVCCADGLGVARDEAEAVKWFRKAAEQNYAAAQYSLGLCYRDGFGVAKDDAGGEKWFNKAIEQGFIPPNVPACPDAGSLKRPAPRIAQSSAGGVAAGGVDTVGTILKDG
jgi:TPR repeat protein